MSTATETKEYTGRIVSLGGAELSKAGKEKPRKAIITDKPEYQGKTFRCWPDSPEWASLELAASNGYGVTVGFVSEDVTFGDKSWTQHMIQWVSVDEPGAPAADDWGAPTTAPAFVSDPVDDWNQGVGAGTPAANAGVGNTKVAPHQTPSPASSYDHKDKVITASAVVKSLTEGRYLSRENLESGEFKTMVKSLVSLIHEVASE